MLPSYPGDPTIYSYEIHPESTNRIVDFKLKKDEKCKNYKSLDELYIRFEKYPSESFYDYHSQVIGL